MIVKILDTKSRVQLNYCSYCACLYVAESRFLEPPRETKISSRNREFEKTKVASNDAKLLRYCFIRGKYGRIRSNKRKMTDLSLDCCVTKRENNTCPIKLNALSGSVYLLQGANVTGISPTTSSEGSSYGVLICTTGVENWFEFAGVSNNPGFEKSGV